MPQVRTGRVLVVGSGIAGLIATKVLRDDGFDVLCVDKEPKVGGCWNHAFDFVTLQASRDEYRYPGIPFPDGTPFRPGKDHVLLYWKQFVDMFHLHPHIKLNTEVAYLGRSKSAAGKWLAELRLNGMNNVQGPSIRQEQFDYVVIATGIGYGNPNLACAPNISAQSFTGSVQHAIDVAPDFMPKNNEKSVIVGFGPTALAFADTYARNACNNGLVHLVVREKRWFAPPKLFGLIPHVSVFFTRAAGVMLPSFTHNNIPERLIHNTFIRWLITPFWWILHLLVILSVRPPRHMVPSPGSALKSLRNSIPVLPDMFFRQCREGRITVHVPASVESLGEGGDVALSNGTVIRDVDLLIYCTGYKTDPFSWMDSCTRDVVLDNGRPKQLYRHIVAPGVENMAFIGFGSGFLGCVTEFLAANWISSLFQGRLHLPSCVEMEKSSCHVQQWKKENLFYEPHFPYAIGARFLNYIDELVSDMGLSTYRKSSAVAWFFEKWGPDDYINIPKERLSLARTLEVPGDSRPSDAESSE